jgi:hypothetical protein
MVEQKPSKLMTRVRFPSPAPMLAAPTIVGGFSCSPTRPHAARQTSGKAAAATAGVDCLRPCCAPRRFAHFPCVLRALVLCDACRRRFACRSAETHTVCFTPSKSSAGAQESNGNRQTHPLEHSHCSPLFFATASIVANKAMCHQPFNTLILRVSVAGAGGCR